MRIFLLGLISLLLISCSSETDEKLPDTKWETYEAKALSFEYADGVVINTELPPNSTMGEWITLTYPMYGANIYCTYLPIAEETLYAAYEDARRMIYGHITVAKGMKEERVKNELANSQGIIFNFEGEVATPFQFFVTDSVSHFFRGSLYYEDNPNMDSIIPVTKQIKADITHLIETIEWKSTSNSEQTN